MSIGQLLKNLGIEIFIRIWLERDVENSRYFTGYAVLSVASLACTSGMLGCVEETGPRASLCYMLTCQRTMLASTCSSLCPIRLRSYIGCCWIAS